MKSTKSTYVADKFSPSRILRRHDVCARTGLSRATLDRLEAEGGFVRRIKIGVRAVGWLEADVEDWISNLHSGVRP